jgi:Protein of unknown function (DUF3305)
MPTFTREIGVVIERRKPKSQWIDVIWEAHAILPEPPEVAVGTSLGKTGDDELFYGGSFLLEAHTVETEQYRLNLNTHSPKIWVVLRPQPDNSLPEIAKVTCDPSEGEGFTETGWDIVNMIPMPEVIHAALLGFVEEHHVETPFYKRKRDRADPEALAKGRKGPDRDRFLRELAANQTKDQGE